MNTNQARELLLLYRSGTPADPEIEAALDLTKSDDGLRRWFDAHCAAQEKVRRQFARIAIPEGLREQIIAERPAAAVRSFSVARVAVLCVVVLAAMFLVPKLSEQMTRWKVEREAGRFANYSAAMISYAINAYGMDLTTGDLQKIRDYLAVQQSPTDYLLPPGLEKATPTGCVASSWYGRPVAMICFRSPGATGQGSDLWFFVVNRETLRDTPENSTPQFSVIAGVPAASWSVGKHTYLLALQGDVGRLKTLVQ